MMVTVTPNPAIDITYDVPRLEPGEVVRVRAVRRRPGGKGVNVARVVHALGHEAVVVAPVGGAPGAELTALLAAAGVPAALTSIEGSTRCTTVVVDALGTTTGLYEPGPRLARDEVQALVTRIAAEAVAASVAVIAGSLPTGAETSTMRDLVLAARSGGARVVVDTSGPALLVAAEAGADVLKPNAEELSEATGERDLRDAARRLLDLGAGAVLVSRGVDGLTWFGREERLDVVGVPAQHGNTAGAGDAVVAALAVGWASGDPLPETLRRCAAAGAAAVASDVAGSIDPAAMNILMSGAKCEVAR